MSIKSALDTGFPKLENFLRQTFQSEMRKVTFELSEYGFKQPIALSDFRASIAHAIENGYSSSFPIAEATRAYLWQKIAEQERADFQDETINVDEIPLYDYKQENCSRDHTISISKHQLSLMLQRTAEHASSLEPHSDAYRQGLEKYYEMIAKYAPPSAAHQTEYTPT